MAHTVIATFPSDDAAEAAVGALRDAGVATDHIGALLADSGESHRLLEADSGSAGKSAAIGSIAGATLFGLAAVALASTPVGILAVGPLAALLGGGIAGGAAGGLLGAIVGLGIPEHEAALRVEAIQHGGVIVTVRIEADGDRERIQKVLSGAGAREVFSVEA